MKSNGDLAVASHVSVSGDAWVAHCALDRPTIIDQRTTPVAPGWWTAVDRATEVLFDGTIFEIDALVDQLNLPRDTANNPAAVLLEAYLRFGDRCLDRIRGHFAFVIGDHGKRRLLAARDRMGMHPLFYARVGADLLWSSSVDALLAQPEVPRELDRVVLGEHLLHRWVDCNETVFSAVRRVPPGHAVTVEAAGMSVKRFWDPGASMVWLRDDEAGLFDAVFERAVGRAMGQDRSAIFLSGGFDSVSVAAMAADIARHSSRPAPHALSLGFPDADCSEEFVQRSVAQSLNLSQDFVQFDDALQHRSLLQSSIELGATWPVPMLNVWAPAYQHLASIGAQRHCSAILTGTGGDEWLNVSPYLAADLIRHGQFVALARLIRTHQRSFQFTKAQILRSSLWTFGLRPLAGAAIDTMATGFWQSRRHAKLVASTPAWVAPDPNIRRAINERAGAVLLRSRPRERSFYEQHIRLALDHPLVALEYEEYFEFGRRLGLQVRHPYLDADLVALLYRTPPSLLMKGGRTKSLIRKSVATRFPALGFERQRKMDATGFFRDRLQAEGQRAWCNIGGASTLSDMGLVQRSNLEAELRNLFEGRRPRETYRIWQVLSLEAWARARA